MSSRPRPTDVPRNAPPTPPSDQAPEHQDIPARADPAEVIKPAKRQFTDEEAAELLKVAQSILEVLPENEEDAWAEFAKEVSGNKKLPPLKNDIG